MAFPVSPANGDIYNNYIYNAASGAWRKLGAVRESGSNASGRYLWLVDGTLIQWGSFYVTVASFGQGSNASSAYEPYYHSLQVSFPVDFADTDYGLSFSAGLGTGNYPIEAGYKTENGRTISSASVAINSNYPYNGETFHCTFMAIGTK